MGKYIIRAGVILMICFIYLSACGRSPAKEDGNTLETAGLVEEEANKADIINISRKKNTILLKCAFSKPIITENDTGDKTLNVSGLKNSYDTTGMPFLSVKILMPNKKKLDEVTAEWQENGRISGVELSKTEYAPISEEGDSVSGDCVSDHGMRVSYFLQKLSGIPILYINVYPVSYNMEEQVINYSESAEIVLSFKVNGEGESVRLPEKQAIDEIIGLVDNPDDFDRFYKQTEG